MSFAGLFARGAIAGAALLAALGVLRELTPLADVGMSYMYPNYTNMEGFCPDVPRGPAGGYAMWRYHEMQLGLDTLLDGLPVMPGLFIPGNAGDEKQVRSIASHSDTVLADMVRSGECGPSDKKGSAKSDFQCVRIAWHALSTNEELSAFDSRVLKRHAALARRALSCLTEMYCLDGREVPGGVLDVDCPAGPRKIVLAGHSMGGVIVQMLLAEAQRAGGGSAAPLPASAVSAVLLLSAPNASPPLGLQPSMWDTYGDIASGAALSLAQAGGVSLSGGSLDWMVRPRATRLPSAPAAIVHVDTRAMPGVWASVGHQQIVWAQQLCERLARGLLRAVAGHGARAFSNLRASSASALASCAGERAAQKSAAAAQHTSSSLRVTMRARPGERRSGAMEWDVGKMRERLGAGDELSVLVTATGLEPCLDFVVEVGTAGWGFQDVTREAVSVPPAWSTSVAEKQRAQDATKADWTRHRITGGVGWREGMFARGKQAPPGSLAVVLGRSLLANASRVRVVPMHVDEWEVGGELVVQWSVPSALRVLPRSAAFSFGAPSDLVPERHAIPGGVGGVHVLTGGGGELWGRLNAARLLLRARRIVVAVPEDATCHAPYVIAGGGAAASGPLALRLTPHFDALQVALQVSRRALGVLDEALTAVGVPTAVVQRHVGAWVRGTSEAEHASWLQAAALRPGGGLYSLPLIDVEETMASMMQRADARDPHILLVTDGAEGCKATPAIAWDPVGALAAFVLDHPAFFVAVFGCGCWLGLLRGTFSAGGGIGGLPSLRAGGVFASAFAHPSVALLLGTIAIWPRCRSDMFVQRPMARALRTAQVWALGVTAPSLVAVVRARELSVVPWRDAWGPGLLAASAVSLATGRVDRGPGHSVGLVLCAAGLSLAWLAYDAIDGGALPHESPAGVLDSIALLAATVPLGALIRGW
ncbi:unnamed protein product [Pedinophyceae sp. YPF-701]|nr:unnamed protein product [Pedinophyceae sp. YPF-701]